jgi:hypothetical protein
MNPESGKTTLKLASLTDDQVFVAITPCRIVDSRLSGGGGPIAFSTQRTYYFYTDTGGFSWSFQGGVGGLSSTSCPGTVNPGAPGGNDGAPSAAVATVTAVSPTAAGNFIVWGGQGTPPTSSVINFAAGQTLANTTVIPWGGRTGPTLDFMVRYNGPSGQADVVVDVVGYFIENHATALQCVHLQTTGTGTGNIPAGGIFSVNSPTCTAGYTKTGSGCSYNVFPPLTMVESSPGTFNDCYWRNDTGSAQSGTNLNAEVVCCRVPGQ